MSSEAPQTLTAYDVLAWLEVNKKPLIIGFVAAVVVGFSIAAYRYSSDKKEVAASDALLKLKASIGGDETASQAEPSAFLNVAKQYPDTTAGERALFLAASALFTDGKYQEAQAQFAKFLQERPHSPFAATAAYGIATSLEAQNKLDDALAAYQNLSVRYPNSAVLNDSKLAIARLHEAKKQPEQALRIYDELAKPTVMSAVTAEASVRRNALLLQHPELVKTNAAAASAPQATNAISIPAQLQQSSAPVAASTNATPAQR